jgi:uncharacterized glyoxalase superfamily protein PhnB
MTFKITLDQLEKIKKTNERHHKMGIFDSALLEKFTQSLQEVDKDVDVEFTAYWHNIAEAGTIVAEVQTEPKQYYALVGMTKEG